MGRLVLAACIPTAFMAHVSNAQFTPDRLAVLEYPWNGTLPDPGGPLLIREFAFDGTPGVVLNVPSSGPNAVVNSQNAFNGAQLTLTPAADKLVFTGFTTTALAGTALQTSSSADIPRAIGTVDAAGNFARPMVTTAFDGGRMKAVFSDGTGYWAGGDGGGIRYLGPGTPSVIASDGASIDAMHVSPGGDLYTISSAVVSRVGPGPPTTPVSPSPMFNSSVGVDFQLSPSGDLCYTTTTTSVRKWVRSGATWTNVYNFSSPGWLVRIAVDFRGPAPVIYALHNLPSKLVKFVDNGAPVSETILATSPSTVSWYGLSFTPGTTCGAGLPCDDGNPATGNDLVQPDCVCAGQETDCAGIAGGSAWPGTPCSDGDPNTGLDLWQANCTCVGQHVKVGVKMILAGALPTTGAFMNDQLRTSPSFPLTEPYSALGLPPSGGATTIAPAVLAVAGLNAIVDWVLVELRGAGAPTNVLARRTGLLQRDGDVVELDGLSPLSIPIAPGNYHVVVRHRNHLGAMTALPILLAATPVTVDLRMTSTATWGSGALRNMGSFWALWNGDVSYDGTLGYTGPNNDRDPILTAVGGTTPNNSVSNVYDRRDVNLDGVIRYTGTNNDRDPILTNVGSTTPNNTRTQQLP